MSTSSHTASTDVDADRKVADNGGFPQTYHGQTGPVKQSKGVTRMEAVARAADGKNGQRYIYAIMACIYLTAFLVRPLPLDRRDLSAITDEKNW